MYTYITYARLPNVTPADQLSDKSEFEISRDSRLKPNVEIEVIFMV